MPGATSLTMSSTELKNAATSGPPVAWFVLDRRLDQAAVDPPDVGQPSVVGGAVLGAPPGGFGRQVEHAEACGLAGGVGTALKMGAFLTHWHPTMVPRRT